MKKIAILTSILALTACGGGSGGHHNGTEARTPDHTTYDPIVLAQKLKTIQYVESNLGSLISGGELQGNTSGQTDRSATVDKFNSGEITADDLNARYEEAAEYFEIMEKVSNANAGNTESNNLTNKEVRIAYSLSANKPYDEITQYDLPGIDLDKENENETVDTENFFANTQISINDKMGSNIDLKESVTQDIANDIPVLTSNEPIDPNASLINANLLGNVSNISELSSMFKDFSFTVDNGVISGATIGDEEGTVDLKRVNNSSVFKSIDKVWYFTIRVQDQDGHTREVCLEDLTQRPATREELANLMQQEFTDPRYNNIPEIEKNNAIAAIRNNPEFGTWEGVIFTGDMHSLGKINGLQYSDFGYYTLSTYNFTFTYDGGMEDKKMAKPEVPTGTMEFRGTAAGELQQNLTINGEDMVGLENNNRPIITNTGAAKLIVDNETETMDMPFNDWYKVTVVKDKTNNHVRSIDFDANGVVVPTDWEIGRLNNSYLTDTTFQNTSEGIEARKDWGGGEHTQTTLTTTYYGNGESPTEATGYVNHVYEHEYMDGDDHIERQVWFSTVFGGTKQPNE